MALSPTLNESEVYPFLDNLFFKSPVNPLFDIDLIYAFNSSLLKSLDLIILINLSIRFSSSVSSSSSSSFSLLEPLAGRTPGWSYVSLQVEVTLKLRLEQKLKLRLKLKLLLRLSLSLRT